MTDNTSASNSRRGSRRIFDFSSVPSTPGTSTPALDQFRDPFLSPTQSTNDEPVRTRSILNLTSSTLSGIYQAWADDPDDASAAWGNGAATPIGESRNGRLDLSKINIPDTVIVDGPNGKVLRRRNTQAIHRRRKNNGHGQILPLVGRLTALYGLGVLYGALVTHLHDRQEIAPVKVEGIDRVSWAYLTFWGLAGIFLGEALPFFDTLWASDNQQEDDGNGGEIKSGSRIRDARGVGTWSDVLRSIGTFAGIAFAIRKLPWESTLQLSLTLALANPAIWYLIDRTTSGFLLSTVVSLGFTALLLGTNPQLVPTPRPMPGLIATLRGVMTNDTLSPVSKEELVFGIITQEEVGVATWIASVLFVSAVCFGNIGRRLATTKG